MDSEDTFYYPHNPLCSNVLFVLLHLSEIIADECRGGAFKRWISQNFHMTPRSTAVFAD